MSKLLETFQELNLSNYGPDDVDQLNAWAIDAYAELSAIKAPEPVAEFFALDDGIGTIMAAWADGFEPVVGQMLYAEPVISAKQQVALPEWAPCNPGCDPEFNGQRSAGCARYCENARAAMLVAAPALVSEAKAQGVYSTDPLACTGCASGCFRCAQPAGKVPVHWTGCHDADIALNLLDRINAPDDEDRISQLEQIVMRMGKQLAATPTPPAADAGVTDSDRLVFMLACHRKVVVECLPGDGYEVYVEQGFMGDIKYPAVSFKGDNWENNSDNASDLKRKAIDAAITAHRVHGVA